MWLFLLMELFIYSDESGVFDVYHNHYFVFGGVICFGKDMRDYFARRYASVEKTLTGADRQKEMKACLVSNKVKGKLYRCTKKMYRFCVYVDQEQLHKSIFENKKHKQRYLDYIYKMALKKCIAHLLEKGYIQQNEIKRIYVNCDEHHTCTDGIYELKEALLNEFKNGTFNSNYGIFYPPILEGLEEVAVKFYDSKQNYLIRASDIIANHFYHLCQSDSIMEEENAFILAMPSGKIRCYGDDFFIDNPIKKQGLGKKK